jgi:transketolase
MKMSKPMTMRDAFLTRLYNFAKKDRNVILVDADMGAPALDRFRKELPSQFVNVGIAEQNMIAVAAGLAMEGKKTFTYAIAPFITSRCHEFTKVDVSLMNLPISLLGCGAGFSYDDSGPTHHTTEDIAIMRAIPKIEILCPSDSNMAAAFAQRCYESQVPVYVRIDRKIQPEINSEQESFDNGFQELASGEKIAIVATGNMVHSALEVRKRVAKQGVNLGVLDLYRLKPINHKLIDSLTNYNRVISLEEHLLDGGLGSILAELIADKEANVRLTRMGLTRYVYAYGGRENIQRECGIDVDSIERKVLELSN